MVTFTPPNPPIMMPPMMAKTEQIRNVTMRIRRTRTPESCAARTLSPMARICLPKFER